MEVISMKVFAAVVLVLGLLYYGYRAYKRYQADK